LFYSHASAPNQIPKHHSEGANNGAAHKSSPSKLDTPCSTAGVVPSLSRHRLVLATFLENQLPFITNRLYHVFRSCSTFVVDPCPHLNLVVGTAALFFTSTTLLYSSSCGGTGADVSKHENPILMSACRDFPAEGPHDSVASGHAQLCDC